jgi:hypothetical protein
MFLRHITNFVAARESVNDKKLAPSAYLDGVEISNSQIEMLKPTHKQVVMGTICTFLRTMMERLRANSLQNGELI